MQEAIKKYIFEGNYHLAEEVCGKMKMPEIHDILLTLAYDTDSICIYSFIRYMISKTNLPSWIGLAVEVMIHPLCHIEGAYSIALFHSRELLKLEYNEKNLEMILFFYDIPEKLITQSEAESVAKELLAIAPENKVALSVLERSN
ncbi:MAG: hypothetical protein IJL67_03390 [Oscillospiraceae bacterium]|nr:hypothetical protein [Oscillospiraceae bacterium]